MDQERSKAEEDLRVIWSLMERATVYRAISAPAALVAGFLSIFAAAAIYLNDQTNINRPVTRPRVCRDLVDRAGNRWCHQRIFHLARSEQGWPPIYSSGMKLTLRAIAPNLLIPAAVTLWFLVSGYKGAAEQELVVAWIAFYGLALLSTGLFAPRSLVCLGGHSC